jgi:hypothetical protein
MESIAAQMHALFRGREDAYGKWIGSGKTDERGKELGKGNPVWARLTDDRWKMHLEGVGNSIGVVPVSAETDSCIWGCIDNDDYKTIDTKYWLNTVAEHEYPLVICKSKSNGLHFFLFLSEPLPAKAVQNYLHDIAANLRLGDKEIFPKQSKVGHLGNWLNMPYFGNTRRCITLKGELDVSEFLKLANSKKIDKLPKTVQKADYFPDGPPCLEMLHQKGGCGEHEKHNTLFDIGVYFRQASPDNWASKLHSVNQDPAMFPKGGHEQIEGVIEGLSKEDYNYLCSQPPIKQYCNRTLCVTRLYGVTRGTDACLPVELLIAPDGQKSVTYAKVFSKGIQREIELTTDDLVDWGKYLKVCYDQIQNLPILSRKQKSDWVSYIKSLPKTILQQQETFEDDLLERLKRYCLNHQTQDRDDLLLNEKLVYIQLKRKRVWFKAKAIAKLLGVSTPTLERQIRRFGENAAELGFPGNINHRFSWLPFEVVFEGFPEVETDLEKEPI